MTARRAISPMHRCYQYGTSQTSFIKAAIGIKKCVVLSRQRFGIIKTDSLIKFFQFGLPKAKRIDFFPFKKKKKK